MEKYYTPTMQELLTEVVNNGNIYGHIYNTDNLLQLCFDTPIENSLKIFIENGSKENDIYSLNLDIYKLKYLDREDIESLGFKCTEVPCPFMGIKLECKLNTEIGFNTGENVTLEFWEKLPLKIHIKIETYGSYENSVNTSKYTIKNKSELKGLMKKLGV